MRNIWNVDNSHSEVQFKIKHMVISTVSGYFLDFTAKAESEDDTFQGANFEFEAKIDSINTKNPQRDEHLKSDDFFKSSEFPTMKFEGKLDGDKLNGDLTIKGVTKSVSLDADFGGVITDPYGNQRSGFELTGEINRKDFGLNWDALTESGGVVVSDKVKLFVNLEFVKQ
jgi:polyisoprenoid-binding protein YceI